MTIYTPTPAYSTSYTLPDDGDEIDAASLNVIVEPLANSIEYLQQNKRVINTAYKQSNDSTSSIYTVTAGSTYQTVVLTSSMFSESIATDEVLVWWHGHVDYDAVVADRFLQLAVTNANGTGADYIVGATVQISGNYSNGIRQQVLMGRITLSTVGLSGLCIAVLGKCSSGTMTIYNPSCLIAELVRNP